MGFSSDDECSGRMRNKLKKQARAEKKRPERKNTKGTMEKKQPQKKAGTDTAQRVLKKTAKTSKKARKGPVAWADKARSAKKARKGPGTRNSGRRSSNSSSGTCRRSSASPSSSSSSGSTSSSSSSPARRGVLKRATKKQQQAARRLLQKAERIMEDKKMLKANKQYIKDVLKRIEEKRRTLHEPTFTAEVKCTFTIASDCSGLGTDHIAAKKAHTENQLNLIKGQHTFTIRFGCSLHLGIDLLRRAGRVAVAPTRRVVAFAFLASVRSARRPK